MTTADGHADHDAKQADEVASGARGANGAGGVGSVGGAGGAHGAVGTSGADGNAGTSAPAGAPSNGALMTAAAAAGPLVNVTAGTAGVTDTRYAASTVASSEAEACALAMLVDPDRVSVVRPADRE